MQNKEDITMKLKKISSLALVAAMTLSMVACGDSAESTTSTEAGAAESTGDETLSYANIVLG